ncbi:MAG TPA: cytochrome b/b6 domain-containing protein [Paracoccus solventivorans]|uniref:cytochrome b n=1 Tax=Paracoccus solventivorans TaxID=53463 RepID=UPI002BA1679C|nr:cytochrome b/b6 domain-containing protein [Paracoccus solventivorans]HMM07519.1 cytochrome b/b6 domain-containing protein [Paracoccus solventivorans]
MSRRRYILIARILHWLLAIGIVAEIILGLYGDRLPYGAGQAAARTTTIYAFHKTLGVALLAIALAFAIWMRLGPPRTGSGRQAVQRYGWDHALARLVHWGLLIAIFAIPLTGPVLHGNGPSWGYAPILWPFGDRIPGIPDRFASHPAVAAFHIASWWLFAGLSIVHVLLWLRRRRQRRKAAGGALPLPKVSFDARTMRWAPLGGLLIWLIFAVVVA